MATTYQSVRIKPPTMRSLEIKSGDISYLGISRSSTQQQVYDTASPYIWKYLTEGERALTTFNDMQKVELSYLLTNLLKMWLFSKIGDYGRNFPGMGGPLDEYIGKPISQERAEAVKASLLKKILTTFPDTLSIEAPGTGITVTPVPERKVYSIMLTFEYIPINKAFSVSSELSV